jgi:hypothetical protein
VELSSTDSVKPGRRADAEKIVEMARLNATVPQDTPLASFDVRADQRLPSFGIFVEACFQFLISRHGMETTPNESAHLRLDSAHVDGTACVTKILW